VTVVTSEYTRSGFTSTIRPPRPGIYYNSVAIYNPLPALFSVQNGVSQNTLSGQSAQLFSVPSSGSPPVLTPAPSAFQYGSWTGPVQAVWFDPDDAPGAYPTPLSGLIGTHQWTPTYESVGGSTGSPGPMFFAPGGTLLSITFLCNEIGATGNIQCNGVQSSTTVGSATLVTNRPNVMLITQDTGDTEYVLFSPTGETLGVLVSLNLA